MAGARVEVAPYKRDPMDFVLWKPSKAGRAAGLAESPCGIAAPGRPGWHIECSAMAWKISGRDFRHSWRRHRSRLSRITRTRSRNAMRLHTGVMANFWMHNGFLQVEGEKMSKSLGNFFTIRELLADWPGEVLRFNMLRTHYRQPIDWTRREPRVKVEKSFMGRIRHADHGTAEQVRNAKPDPEAFLAALKDDLNTPPRSRELHQLALEGVISSGVPRMAPDELVRLAATIRVRPSCDMYAKIWLASRLVGPLNADSAREIGLDPRRSSTEVESIARGPCPQGEELRRNPTASAMNSSRWAWCSRIPRMAPPGRSRDERRHAT